MLNDARNTRSVSIYFFAGDFAQAVRDHAEGREHSYATHGEIALLVDDLVARGIGVTLHSFMTPTRKMEEPRPGVRVISLGARHYDDRSSLRAALAEDEADTIIPHFPNVTLLKEAARLKRRVFPMMANSFNRTGPRSRLLRWRTMRALNDRRFDLVANHCRPATEALARHGVDPGRLIAWDVPHKRTPADSAVRSRVHREGIRLAYAGSISEDKGVGDLVRAVGLLRRNGRDVHVFLAGNGDIAAMKALAASEGVADLVDFAGMVDNHRVLHEFKTADLVVVPSRSAFPEGFPLTLFEAIAVRTPIVCSDHPMFVPVLTDGETAVMYRNGDPAGLADAIGRVLADDALYEALSRHADVSWAKLSGTADWRTLVRTFVTEGADAPWIRAHMLAATRLT